MSRKHTFSLRTHTIVTCFSLVVLPFLLMTGLNFSLHRRSIRRSVDREILLLSAQKSQALDTCFSSVEYAVDAASSFVLLTLDEARARNDAAYGTEYNGILSSALSHLCPFPAGLSAMYFVPAQSLAGNLGAVFLVDDGHGSFSPAEPGLVSPDDSWYQLPFKKGKPVWSGLRQSAAAGEPAISYAVPVYREQRFLGVAGIDLGIEGLSAQLGALPVQGMHVMLSSSDGSVLYSSDVAAPRKKQEDSASKGVVSPALPVEETVSSSLFFWDGVRHIGGRAGLRNGMSLLVAVPYADVIKVRNQLLLEQLVLLLLVLVLFALVLRFAMARFINPVKMLTDATHKIAGGNLGIDIPYRSDNEIGQLADSIRKMASQMLEYIAYIQRQTEQEREAKEAALTESRSKSEFLASMYVSMHEIDLDTDSFSEILNKEEHRGDEEKGVTDADFAIHQVMSRQAAPESKAALLEFIDFSTLNERMRGKITISHEFRSARGVWYRGSFILVDTHPDGTLHHVIWAVENIEKERHERERLRQEADANAAASRAKSAFLANMSHEIRTPINAVLGMDEMILRECEDSTILGYALNIKNAGTTLLSIINDILDFSKIEAGKMEILPENYDLASVLVDLVNMVSLRAQKKGLELVLDVSPYTPRSLYGDSVRLKQCILNLLTNAVKYTGSGSVRFSVSAEKCGEDAVLLHVSVRDTGSGIRKEDMDKLFSPFERIEEGKNRTEEGSGLGMSIVQKTLAMMGSRLEVRSEYGKGSEFFFSVRQEVTDWTGLGDIGETFRSAVDRIERYKETLYAPRARLLFVDDTEMNLEVIRGLLKNTGIQIDTVTSGAEALEKVQENAYDILFIDHRMPGMDGIQTLRELRSLSQGPAPGSPGGIRRNLSAGKPCIALTANAISGAKKMYLEEGFTDYLSKPVTPERLEAAIRRYLPPDMLEQPPEDAGAAAASGAADNDAALADIRGLEGIDADAALANCGTVEVLRNALAQFHGSVGAKAGELQRLLDEGNLAGYGTKVHALKSTARLIGATELSRQAAYLEQCADSGAGDEVAAKHGAMLELYRSYERKLERCAAAASGAGSPEKPELPPDVCSGLLRKLSSAVQDFSIDGVDGVMEEFRKYTVSPSFAPIYEKIRLCAENVDFTGLKALLPAVQGGQGE